MCEMHVDYLNIYGLKLMKSAILYPSYFCLFPFASY